ncbi:MAG TPA: SDR family NAD(P)-dependent oxidoreductase [Dermatophilaceae bacterium]|nr:SDR family NAD(P)-dependent oxidoreductase [Dermatophilaceae bacterium]
MHLAGSHVLLTGATGVIGRRLAARLAVAGARVSLVARGHGALEELAAEVGGWAVSADLTDPAALAGVVAGAEERGGPVDVLVNNAGVETAGHLADATAEDVASTVGLNLTAPLELTRQVLPGMLERRRGHVVAISSLSGVATFPGLAVYGGTKAGLTHAMSGIRADLRGTDVGTLTVEIGPVVSEMMDRIGEHGPTARSFDRALRLGALGLLEPDAVASAVVQAVRSGRPHLRLPRRAAPLARLTGAPRVLVRTALTGIPGRPPADAR